MTIVLLGWGLPLAADESGVDEQKPQLATKSMMIATPRDPALLPSWALERSPSQPIHNPAGSEMLVAGLTIPVTCDGWIDPTEWSDAYMYDISDTTGQEDGVPDAVGTVTLWLKQDDVGVYFAVRNNVDQTLNDYDEVGLFFDDDYDGCWPVNTTTEGNEWLDYLSTGITARWRWWQDIDCGFPPNYVCTYDNVGGAYYWTPTCFGIGIGPTGNVDFEVMIPYGPTDEHLDLTMPPDSLGFFVFCMDNGTGLINGSWPNQGYATTFREPCYFGRLICDTAEDSLYWKPPYEDYAPSGMPDLSQLQDGWYKAGTGQHTFCGPCAVANCFKWFDSKYNVPPGSPGDAVDMFPLVRDYMFIGNPPYLFWDDHDPWNMDHFMTPWAAGATPPPPPTPQPFVPGPQPLGVMPPWGELVERLAWYFNTDGVRYGYCSHLGTEVHQMYQGIQEWFDSEWFEDGSTLADTLCVNLWKEPTFDLVETLVEKCEDVILLLGFWYEFPPGSGQWWRCGGHYVTVAGINSQDYLIAVSDPFFDWAELGFRGRILNGQYIPHNPGHDPTAHNDEGNVSHDMYMVIDEPISPGGLWELIDYPVSVRPWYCDDWSFQNIPEEFLAVSEPWPGADTPVFTEVEYAIQISPWDYRGDANGDGLVDNGDIIYVINYLFTGTSPPDPFSEGDVNCDGIIDSGDIVRLINYLFLGASLPKCCDP
jgi:hypothetical protein